MFGKKSHRHFILFLVIFLMAQASYGQSDVASATPRVQQAIPDVPKSDQARSGEQFFYEYCSACHHPSSRLRSARAPQLIGLFKRSGVTEATVRERILQGLPGLMPSFQYSLTSEEIDHLIAFLKLDNLGDILEYSVTRRH